MAKSLLADLIGVQYFIANDLEESWERELEKIHRSILHIVHTILHTHYRRCAGIQVAKMSPQRSGQMYVRPPTPNS